MDLGLDGKTALVTGANRGIGMAIAKELAREGCAVAMCSRDTQSIADAAQEVEEQTSTKAVGIAADVLNPDDASRLVAEPAAQLGGGKAAGRVHAPVSCVAVGQHQLRT